MYEKTTCIGNFEKQFYSSFVEIEKFAKTNIIMETSYFLHLAWKIKRKENMFKNTQNALFIILLLSFGINKKSQTIHPRVSF